MVLRVGDHDEGTGDEAGAVMVEVTLFLQVKKVYPDLYGNRSRQEVSVGSSG